MNATRTVQSITATEAKNRFGKILRRAYAQTEHTIIERSGIPVAVLIPIQDYERLLDDQGQPDAASERLTAVIQEANARQRLRAFLAEAHQSMPDLPEDEVEQDIQDAVTVVRSHS